MVVIICSRQAHFSFSSGTPPPFFWGTPPPLLVPENLQKQCTFPLATWAHPPNHNPQASGDSGRSKGRAHASSRLFLYAYWERHFFGGWNCSPGSMYGQPFSHSQEERQYTKRALTQREQGSRCRETASEQVEPTEPNPPLLNIIHL